jgi:O-antigen/teichoic acid export membrane protein
MRVNYGSVIASLLLGFGLWSLLIGFVLNFAVNVVVLYWIAFKTAGPFRALPIVPTRDEFRAIGSYYGLVLIGYVSASLRDQTDKIVLSSMASPLSVGYYSIASRLAGLVIEVNRFFYLPTLAATASLNAAGDWPAVRKLFSMMMTIGALVSGSVVVVVASQYDRLIVLWMGKTIHEVVPFLLLLLAGNTFAVILTGVGTSLCRAVDRVGIETTYVTVNLVINIFLTISLVLLIGPIGTVISSAVSWGGSAVVFIVVLHRQLDLPTEGTLKAVRVMGAVALTALIMRGLARALPLSETRAASLVSLSWLVPLTLAIYFALCLSMKIVSRAQIEIVLGEWRDAIMGRAPHRNNARVS